MITVLFFAGLRDQLGTDRLLLDPLEINSTGQLNTTDLVRYICQKTPSWQTIFESQKIFTAVNQEITHDVIAIKDNDEVAFFPPVTGG